MSYGRIGALGGAKSVRFRRPRKLRRRCAPAPQRARPRRAGSVWPMRVRPVDGCTTWLPCRLADPHGAWFASAANDQPPDERLAITCPRLRPKIPISSASSSMTFHKESYAVDNNNWCFGHDPPRSVHTPPPFPGAFPPTMFDVTVDGEPYQEMHVDGVAFGQAFLYPVGLTRQRSARMAAGRRVVPATAYVIRNGRLDPGGRPFNAERWASPGAPSTPWW